MCLLWGTNWVFIPEDDIPQRHKLSRARIYAVQRMKWCSVIPYNEQEQPMFRANVLYWHFFRLPGIHVPLVSAESSLFPIHLPLWQCRHGNISQLLLRTSSLCRHHSHERSSLLVIHVYVLCCAVLCRTVPRLNNFFFLLSFRYWFIPPGSGTGPHSIHAHRKSLLSDTDEMKAGP
jgi:hypothetical protein